MQNYLGLSLVIGDYILCPQKNQMINKERMNHINKETKLPHFKILFILRKIPKYVVPFIQKVAPCHDGSFVVIVYSPTLHDCKCRKWPTIVLKKILYRSVRKLEYHLSSKLEFS